jgi:hypothetical protein
MKTRINSLVTSPIDKNNRSFNTIVDEAVQRIATYCPEWKKPVPGDPGLALIELFAWMTEATMFRMDRIVPKATLALLETLGAVRRPPQAASTVVKFVHSGIHSRANVPAGTRISTDPSRGCDHHEFETASDVEVRNTRVAMVVVKSESGIYAEEPDSNGRLPPDFGSFIPQSESRTRLFAGVSDLVTVSALKTCRSGVLSVRMKIAKPALATDVSWFWFDGLRWNEFESVRDQKDSFCWNLTIPENPMNEFQPDEDKLPGIYVAAVPLDCDYPDFILDQIEFTVTSEDTRLKPNLIIFSDPAGRSRTTHDPSEFLPFGPEPLAGTEFLTALPTEALIPGTKISASFSLKNNETAPSDDLEVVWSVSTGENKWLQLGVASPESCSGPSFQDDSFGMTRTGKVTFVMPAAAAPGTCFDQTAVFLRACIRSGDFGRAGTWELDGEKWSFKDASPLKPPVLSDMNINFTSPVCRFTDVMAKCDGQLKDFSLRPEPFRPFNPDESSMPAVFTGLSGDAGPGVISLYVETGNEQEREDINKSSWQVMSNGKWIPVTASDQTEGMTQNGIISITMPEGISRTTMFGRRLVWIRCLTCEGTWKSTIKAVHINTAVATDTVTMQNKILGSSHGLTGTTIPLASDILPGEKLVVIEPGSGEFGTGDGASVEWKAVDTLAWSGPEDRHYERIPASGVIRFGDGVCGLIPPCGRNNVRLASYQTGGGSSGNVPAFCLDTLSKPIPGVSTVTNPVAATGGYDGDSDDDVLKRAPVLLKRMSGSLTCNDLEVAASEVSRRIHRTKCIESCDGSIRTVIVPRTGTDRPIPDTSLLRAVKTALDRIRPVTTRIKVTGPEYYRVEVTIYAEIDRTKTSHAENEPLKDEIERTVRQYLSPVNGGNGNGWPFGEPVTPAALTRLVTAIPGVRNVSSVLVEAPAHTPEPAGLPDLRNVTVHLG